MSSRATPDTSPKATRLPRRRRSSHPGGPPTGRMASPKSVAYDGEHPTVRVLFFNEGNLGTHILGQGQLDAALHAGLSSAPDVETHFAGLTPMGRWARAGAV